MDDGDGELRQSDRRPQRSSDGLAAIGSKYIGLKRPFQSSISKTDGHGIATQEKDAVATVPLYASGRQTSSVKRVKVGQDARNRNLKAERVFVGDQQPSQQVNINECIFGPSSSPRGQQTLRSSGDDLPIGRPSGFTLYGY